MASFWEKPLGSTGDKASDALKNPGKLLGEIKSNIQSGVFSPWQTGSKLLGIGKGNNVLPWMDMIANPIPLAGFVNLADMASSLLGFKEGQDVIGTLTGSKDKRIEATNKAMDQYKADVKSANIEGNLALDQLKKQGDTLAGNNNIFNPLTVKSTRSAKANAELEQLLKVFEARRQSIATRRAQPGISQTRLG